VGCRRGGLRSDHASEWRVGPGADLRRRSGRLERHVGPCRSAPAVRQSGRRCLPGRALGAAHGRSTGGGRAAASGGLQRSGVDGVADRPGPAVARPSRQTAAEGAGPAFKGHRRGAAGRLAVSPTCHTGHDPARTSGRVAGARGRSGIPQWWLSRPGIPQSGLSRSRPAPQSSGCQYRRRRLGARVSTNRAGAAPFHIFSPAGAGDAGQERLECVGLPGLPGHRPVRHRARSKDHRGDLRVLAAQMIGHRNSSGLGR
jgi:hypothetical protein